MAPIATTDAVDHPRTQERHEKRRRDNSTLRVAEIA
jgi:hypothetical protein